MLKILTRDFGEVEISEDDVITFTEPIFDSRITVVLLC